MSVTDVTSDDGGQLVVCSIYSLAGVSGVVTVGALVLVVVVVGCTVCLSVDVVQFSHAWDYLSVM